MDINTNLFVVYAVSLILRFVCGTTVHETICNYRCYNGCKYLNYLTDAPGGSTVQWDPGRVLPYVAPVVTNIIKRGNLCKC